VNPPIQRPASLSAPQNRVALYARVSKADESQTPQNQLMRLHDYAKASRLQTFDEYVDFASGADPNRPELERMLKDARAHRFHTILVVKLDRIARSNIHLYDLIRQFDESKVTFLCVDQPEVSTQTTTGKALLGILGVMAELERDLIRERTLAGLNRARSEGKTLGRPTKDLDLEEIHAMLEAGHSFEEIAQHLAVSEATVRRRVKNGGSESPNKTSSESPLSQTDDSDRR